MSSLRSGPAGAGPVLVVRTRQSDHRLHAGTSYRLGRDPAPISSCPIRASRGATRRSGTNRDTWILEDVGSTNGTFIGTRRVDRITISSDCVIRLGNPEDGPVLRCRRPPARCMRPPRYRRPPPRSPSTVSPVPPSWMTARFRTRPVTCVTMRRATSVVRRAARPPPAPARSRFRPRRPRLVRSRPARPGSARSRPGGNGAPRRPRQPRAAAVARAATAARPATAPSPPSAPMAVAGASSRRRTTGSARTAAHRGAAAACPPAAHRPDVRQ